MSADLVALLSGCHDQTLCRCFTCESLEILDLLQREKQAHEWDTENATVNGPDPAMKGKSKRLFVNGGEYRSRN